MSTEETQEIPIKDEEPVEEDPEAEEESAANERKDGKGKLPPVPKKAAAVDSTDAAGDVLKQFFNRR